MVRMVGLSQLGRHRKKTFLRNVFPGDNLRGSPPARIFAPPTHPRTEAGMARFTLTINGQRHAVDVAPDTPVLWVLRDNVGLTGTKFGCGIAECGACAVHLAGEATRTCQLAVKDVGGKPITTTEGISPAPVTPTHAVQKAWIEEQVPQCG